VKVDFQGNMGQVARYCGGTLIEGSPDAAFDTITTDSRALGNSNLFIPLKGEKFDGHAYIDELAGSGRLAGFLTMDESHGAAAARAEIAAVLCDDTLAAYGRIAAAHRDGVAPLVVGVTGTNGKTTIKEMAWSVLGRKYRCLKNEKNYNNEVGVPYTLLGLRPEHRCAVIEMGMNHPGEIGRLARIARPDIAVISSVGEGHLGPAVAGADHVVHLRRLEPGLAQRFLVDRARGLARVGGALADHLAARHAVDEHHRLGGGRADVHARGHRHRAHPPRRLRGSTTSFTKRSTWK